MEKAEGVREGNFRGDLTEAFTVFLKHGEPHAIAVTASTRSHLHALEVADRRKLIENKRVYKEMSGKHIPGGKLFFIHGLNIENEANLQLIAKALKQIYPGEFSIWTGRPHMPDSQINKLGTLDEIISRTK